MKKFTCEAVLWFDKVNGNTYHSCRITRHKDGKVITVPFQYGYGEHYKTTAIEAMFEAHWLPKKYHNNQLPSGAKGNLYLYERENDYPIIWISYHGLKRDCVANGIYRKG